MRTWLNTGVLMAVLAGTTVALYAQGRGRGAPPPPPNIPVVIAAAATAMGAATITSIQYSGTGTANIFGQQAVPNGAWPAFRLTSYSATADYTAPAMRIELERAALENSTTPLPGPRQQITAVNGSLAWNIVGAGPAATATAAPGAARERLLSLVRTPHGAIKAAQRAGADIKGVTNGTDRALSFSTDGIPVTVTIGPDDTVSSVETVTATPMMGDTPTVTSFLYYKDFGGVRFPTRIVTTQGGLPTMNLQVADVRVNPPVSIDVPANIRTSAQEPPPVTIDVQRVADGVYYITGGTHHSAAVEFSDHVVLIEAPQNEMRAAVVLEALSATLPSKPVRYVVNTHDHFDHAGGLRTVAAAGIPIVTQTANIYFYQRLFALPHTVAPDRLAQAPRRAVFEKVDDVRVLSDSTRELRLIRVPTDHSSSMLVAYLPKDKLVIEADLFTPPNGNQAPVPSPTAARLLEALQTARAEVTQILALHGRMASLAELEAAAGRAPAR